MAQSLDLRGLQGNTNKALNSYKKQNKLFVSYLDQDGRAQANPIPNNGTIEPWEWNRENVDHIAE